MITLDSIWEAGYLQIAVIAAFMLSVIIILIHTARSDATRLTRTHGFEVKLNTADTAKSTVNETRD